MPAFRRAPASRAIDPIERRTRCDEDCSSARRACTTGRSRWTKLSSATGRHPVPRTRGQAARQSRAVGHRQRHLAPGCRPRDSTAPHSLGHGAGRAGSTWLPRLASYLPVAVPEPVAIGEPDGGYPYRWAVHRWLPGDGATLSLMDDPVRFALNLADVIRALHTVPAEGAPGAMNRARPLQEYNDATLGAIEYASGLIDAERARAVWDEALHAPAHAGAPVWVHGDIEGNCLLRRGRLSAIVDWGSACAGDPAVDIQVVWSPLFTGKSRQVFLDALAVDDATLARSRGAAIHQACGALPYYLNTYPLIVERSWHKLAALGVEPRRAS